MTELPLSISAELQGIFSNVEQALVCELNDPAIQVQYDGGATARITGTAGTSTEVNVNEMDQALNSVESLTAFAETIRQQLANIG